HASEYWPQPCGHPIRRHPIFLSMHIRAYNVNCSLFYYNVQMPVPSQPDGLLRYRTDFPILDRTTYLISNSLGAMPRQVFDEMQRYATTWDTRGVRAWEESWWQLAAEIGDDIGALLNAPRASVSILPNVT